MSKFYDYCRVSCFEVLIFKVILISTLFFIYNLLVWSHYCNFIKEVNNFIYLFIPINNGTWKARVGIFYASKPFIKCKSKTREFHFSQHRIYFSPMLIFYFRKFHLKNAYQAFNCMLTE